MLQFFDTSTILNIYEWGDTDIFVWRYKDFSFEFGWKRLQEQFSWMSANGLLSTLRDIGWREYRLIQLYNLCDLNCVM